MCCLISVAVAAPALDVPAHFRGFELEATGTLNPTVRNAFGSDAVFELTEHGCSCSLQAPRPARDRFLDALAALCSSGAPVRLVSHAYTGRFDRKTFELAPPRRVALGVLALAPFAEDTVLAIVPQG